MSRVTVVGPRRLQRQVVESVQDLGALHVDHVRPADETFAPRPLSEADQGTRAAWDGVRALAEGVLALLPVIEIPPVETGSYLDADPPRPCGSAWRRWTRRRKT